MGAAAVVVIAEYLFVLTDCVISGRVLGEVALGAMNLLMPAFSLVTFFTWLVSSGASAAYMRIVRKGDREHAVRFAGQGLMAALLLGGALVLLVVSLELPYIGFMNPDDATIGFTSQYWRWFPVSVVLESVGMMLLYIVYVDGGELACLNSCATMILVNIGASYWLSYRFGIAGVSLGSVVARLAGIFPLLPRVHDCVKLEFRLDLGAVVRSIRSFWGESLVWLFHSVLFFAITKYVLYFWGSESLPINAVVFCVISLTVFFGGIGVVLSPFERIYRNRHDAEEIARMLKLFAAVSFVVMVLCAGVFFVAPELIIGFFGIESPDLVEGAKRAARITVVGLMSGILVSLFPLMRRVRRSSSAEAPLNYLQTYVIGRMTSDADSQMFNLAKLFKLKNGIDLQRLSDALVASARSHAALLSVLRRSVDGEIVQRQELKPNSIACPIVTMSESEVLANRSQFVKSFDIFGSVLLDAKIFDCGDCAYLLSNFHHLICDGYSFPLILDGAHKVWDGQQLECDSYYEVLARREERSATAMAVASRNFMREILKSNKFTVIPQPDFCEGSGYGAYEVELALPDNFEEFLSARRITRHHVFLAATVLALAKISDADDVLIDWVFHGRVSKDELKTVGAFMVDLPLIVERISEMTSGDLIATIKQSTFRGIKNVNTIRGIDDCNPTGQDRLTFIYQDEWGELMSPGPVRKDGPYAWMIEETIPLTAPSAKTENPFNVEIMEHGDVTKLFVEYDSGRYSNATVCRYVEHYRKSLEWLLG